MNLTLHIIRKDLRRMAWALAVWAVCGLYLVLSGKLGAKVGSIYEKMQIIAMFNYMMLTFALIAGIVQEDGLTESDVFWRTRPTAGRRMLTAKLSLLMPLFVFVPLPVFFVSKHSSPDAFDLKALELVYVVLACVTVLLS